MKYIVAVLFLISLVSFVMGFFAERSGQSEDERVGAAIFYVLGIGFFAADAIVVILWAFYKVFFG